MQKVLLQRHAEPSASSQAAPAPARATPARAAALPADVGRRRKDAVLRGGHHQTVHVHVVRRWRRDHHQKVRDHRGRGQTQRRQTVHDDNDDGAGGRSQQQQQQQTVRRRRRPSVHQRIGVRPSPQRQWPPPQARSAHPASQGLRRRLRRPADAHRGPRGARLPASHRPATRVAQLGMTQVSRRSWPRRTRCLNSSDTASIIITQRRDHFTMYGVIHSSRQSFFNVFIVILSFVRRTCFVFVKLITTLPTYVL